MTGPFAIIRDAMLGEEVWCATTAKGLRLRIAPMPRFVETAAVCNFEYGSIDLGFVQDGMPHASPEGVAHYLEHKLFEDEAIQVFERFGRRGARVNATTGFSCTSYHFTATDRFGENLADLLHLVARAHLTAENVAKERGIIAQEIRMHEDSPDYQAIFALLGCLYPHHPVRHPVGGTVESIARITCEELAACHAAFYRTGNAALGIAGPVDPHEVLALAEACTLASGAPAERLTAEDRAPPAQQRIERTVGAARPRLLLGFKDQDPPHTPLARVERDLAVRVLLDRLFGAASEIRDDLRRRGIADDSLGATYLGDRGFSAVVVHGESEAPERLLAELQRLLAGELPFSEEHLERVRRKMLGQYVRMFENVKAMAGLHASEALHGLAPFQAMERLARLGVPELQELARRLFAPAWSAVAVVR